MPLAAGTRLGVYEILSVLGAGGMGEVYRARDTRLGREVAIKVILDAFAADADRLARFQREAKVLGVAQPPAHRRALRARGSRRRSTSWSWSWSRGETLADRLLRGPLPLAEALTIAAQIADALEAAHEKGIVHRDLKPANVKVTPDDKVKVLDFGLAKAVETEASAHERRELTDAEHDGVAGGRHSRHGRVHVAGAGAGTPCRPPQRHLLVRRRSLRDADRTPAVSRETPRRKYWPRSSCARRMSAGFPQDLNPRLTELLRRCLEKHPKRRWQAIGDVRVELEAIAAAPVTPPVRADAGFGAASTVAPGHTGGDIRARRRRRSGGRSLAVEARASGASRSIFHRHADGPHVDQPACRGDLPGRIADCLRRGAPSEPAAHPRARLVAVGRGRRHQRGVVSSIFAGRALTGVLFARRRHDQAHRARRRRSGLALCRVQSNQSVVGRHWHRVPGHEFRITPHHAGVGEGWKPQVLLALQPNEYAQGPQMLPDGDTLLVSTSTGARVGADRWDHGQIVAYSVKSGIRKVLIEGGSDPRYLPTGHLAYAVGGSVYAMAFDARTLTVSGEPFPIIDGVRRSSTGVTGMADFIVSENGTLAYVPGPMTTSSAVELVVADRQGTLSPLKLQPGPYSDSRVSRDGTRVALTNTDGRASFIAVVPDLAGGSSLRRVTFGGNATAPVLSPDGTRVAFQSVRNGDLSIFSQAIDGTGPAVRLTTAAPGEAHLPHSWSGDFLLYDVIKGADVRLWQLSVKDGKAAPFGDVHSTSETDATFSPDGHWVAYSTTDDDRATNLFVLPFPAAGTPSTLLRGRNAAPHHPILVSRGGCVVLHPLARRPGARGHHDRAAIQIRQPGSRAAPVCRRPAGIATPVRHDARRPDSRLRDAGPVQQTGRRPDRRRPELVPGGEGPRAALIAPHTSISDDRLRQRAANSRTRSTHASHSGAPHVACATVASANALASFSSDTSEIVLECVRIDRARGTLTSLRIPAFMITTIGLDADDTLWHNENVFRLTQERFRGLLAGIADPDVLDERLAEIERRNPRLYGYGVKGFTLSMIETAMAAHGNEAPAA